MEREFEFKLEGHTYPCREVGGIVAIDHDAPSSNPHLEIFIDGVWNKAFDLRAGESDPVIEKRAVQWVQFKHR